MSASAPDSAIVGSHESENCRVVTALFSAISDGRYDDAIDLLAPKATWWVLGKRDFVDPADWFAGLAQLFPNGLRFTLSRVTDGGARVAVQARGEAKLPDGREFDNAYHFAFEMSDGRILAGWEYGDTRYVEQLLRS